MPKLTSEQRAELDRLLGSLVCEVSTRIEAAPEAVWDLVTDIGRIGEFSIETVGAEWVEGATGPEAGAYFLGHNRVGELEWSRLCLVTEAERPRRFAYVVGDRFDGSRTGTWSYALEPDGTGTILRHRFAHEPQGRSGTRLRAERRPERAAEVVEARRRFLQESMANTLEGMRAALEAHA